MVRVKICGIRKAMDVKAAAEAGADALGFVVGFPSSPRNLSLEEAKELLRQVPPFVDRVIVCPADLELLELLSRELGPEYYQVYGEVEEPQSLIRSLRPSRIIRPLKLPADYSDEVLKLMAEPWDALLLDNQRHELGGKGEVGDWELAKRVKEGLDRLGKHLILAGGLRPDNVREAVKRIRPYAVDVSSGVELAPGEKDPNLIRLFVRVAKGGEE